MGSRSWPAFSLFLTLQGVHQTRRILTPPNATGGRRYGRPDARGRPDVFQLALTPRDGINAYLLGDIPVDTGVKASAGKLLEELRGRPLQAIALTHAHAHATTAAPRRRLAGELGLPVWVGSADREATETGKAVKKATSHFATVAGLLGGFPGVPVARELREGDELPAGLRCSIRRATHPGTSPSGATAIAC